MTGTFGGTTTFGLGEPNETTYTPPGNEYGSTDVYIAKLGL